MNHTKKMYKMKAHEYVQKLYYQENVQKHKKHNIAVTWVHNKIDSQNENTCILIVFIYMYV